MKQEKGLKASFQYAGVGLIYAIKSERNMKIHLFCGAVALLLSWLLTLSWLEIGILSIVISMVMVAELMNTAVERAVDLSVGTKFHILAKQAKNVAAAAVLVASINAVFVGSLLFFPKILGYFS